MKIKYQFSIDTKNDNKVISFINENYINKEDIFINYKEEENIVNESKKILYVNFYDNEFIEAAKYFDENEISDVKGSIELSKDEYKNIKFFEINIRERFYPTEKDKIKWDYDMYDFSCNKDDYIKKQKKSYQITKKKIKWRNNFNLFVLNWVFDEIFVNDKLYEEVFSKNNIGKIPVYYKDKIIDNLNQLELDNIDIPIKKSNLRFLTKEKLKFCKGNKYINQIGLFPIFDKIPEKDIFKTKEIFGSGYQEDYAIIVSKKIKNEIENSCQDKINFIPVFDLEKVEFLLKEIEESEEKYNRKVTKEELDRFSP